MRLPRTPSFIRTSIASVAILAGCALLGTGLTAAGRQNATVQVSVTEAGTKQPLPCRLTVLDANGNLASITPAKVPWLAARQGVIYTGTGTATFSVSPGTYTLYANRGMEYGLITRPLNLTGGETRLSLELAREVDTKGYVSCDPHIHTLTHSGHGDATVEERLATIAGEGIELAVATDHNHHTDYTPTAKATGTAPFFTPVVGNEVTTSVGHFNAFPVRPGSPVPDYKSSDWKALLAGIRAVPGVQIVFLNHPSNNHSNFIPTDPKRFNAASGESLDGRSWDFDGIEVVTSAALQSDWMKPYRDWFALLNSGRNIVGLGSSDSHEVNRYILGQGRTYVVCRDAEPNRIDVDEACKSIRDGRVLVSMGLLTEMWAGESSSTTNHQLSTINSPLTVRIRVQGPRWISADRLDLFANGEKIYSLPIVSTEGSVVKFDRALTLPRPAHDAWLVAIASGPGVDKLYWPIPRPYQPTRPDWEPRVIGSSSVAKIDVDRGGYQSPREQAMKILDAAGGKPDAALKSLAAYDSAVAVQTAALLRERGVDLKSGPVRTAIDASAPHVRQALVAYVSSLP